MKKFFKKNGGIVIGVVAILAFVALSVLTEVVLKEKTTEALKDLTVLTENVPNDEAAVVVIGLTYCSHCHNFNPVITKVAGDYNIPVYWFDIDDLSDEDSSTLRETFAEHGYEGSSPYIAVFKNGEVVNNHVGEMTKTATIDFLKESDIIK